MEEKKKPVRKPLTLLQKQKKSEYERQRYARKKEMRMKEMNHEPNADLRGKKILSDDMVGGNTKFQRGHQISSKQNIGDESATISHLDTTLFEDPINSQLGIGGSHVNCCNVRKRKRPMYERIDMDLLPAVHPPAVETLATRLSLPSHSFVKDTSTYSSIGGPRYMVQNYQDAMATCAWAGPPDLFITFTCNPKWIEIQDFLNFIPGQKPEDRPDIIARVFHIKLRQLLDLLIKQHFLGSVMAGC